MAGSANLIQTHNVLRGRLSEDNVIAGTVGTGYNPTYALVGEAAAQIVLYINSSDYKMYAELKDKNSNHIMNSNIIDLPLETMVVNGSYDSETKEVVLILDNGNELRFSVADLVRGLVSEEGLATILGDYVKFTDYATDSASGVLKTNFSNSFSVNPSNGVPYCDGKTYEQYGSAGNGMFIGKQTLENVITGKQLVNKTYVDEADEVFEEDLFGDASIIDSGESIILNNTIEKAPLSITLKGNTYQNSTSGKNVFKIDNGFSNYGITATLDNGGLLLNGTSTQSAALKISDTTIPAGSYTSTIFIESGSHTSHLKLYLDYYVGSRKANTQDFNINNLSKPITLEEEITSVRLGFQSNDTFDNFKINIQVEPGDTSSEYEEYTGGIASPNPDYQQEIEVVTGLNKVKVEGKNLIDGLLNDSSTGKELTRTINSNEGFYLYIESSSTTTDKVYGFLNNEYKGTINVSNSNGILTFSGSQNFSFNRIRLQSDIVATKNMLTLGATATTYEAYKGQTYPINLGSIELCKIGTYQDRIYKNNGNWYLHKEIGKLSYSGNDYYSFTVNSVANDFVQFLTPAIDIIESLPSSVLCNYSVTGGSTASKKIRVNISHSVLGTTSSSTNSEARTAFINKISSKTMVFYYPLETPTDTQITDTTLVSQLNALYNATSYNTQTNISQVTANLPFILDISTFKNTTKGKIEVLKQEDENYEKLSNKVIELSSSSTDTEYPSAKCVYNLVGDVESILEILDVGSGV